MRTFLVLAAIVFPARAAFAYDTGSEVGSECHEALTRAAIADAREALGLDPPPIPSDIDEEALMSDLPFEIDERDGFDTIATTLANREIDLGGHEANQLTRLAQIHGAEENQREHCLRGSAHDEPNGSAEALEDCRAFIREQMRIAFDAAEGEMMMLPTSLALRGEVELPLPMNLVALGRALHTLQDSFSHTFRTADQTKVTSVLNYVELAEDELDPAVDGPAHSGHLDACSDLDPMREERWTLAGDASHQLALIALDPALGRSEKERALDELLAAHLSLEPGCTAENAWCNAPEAEFMDPGPCTCKDTGSSGSSWMWLLALPPLLWLRRKRFALMLAAAICCFAPRPAEASDFGVYVSGSGAIMNAALAGSLGARYSLTDNWTLGLDAEWNPWIGGGLDKVRAGSVNAYATIIFRIPLRAETLNLRSTLQLGASRIMFDLVGVAEGSIGPYVGFNALGIEWAVADDLYLIVDPAHISIPIPQISGVPFAFPQYRVTLGLQWGA